jgi:ABC-type transport system substrate-binding protein
MTSSRPLLRIGTSDLSGILGSELAPAIFWGLLHHSPEGQAVPVLSDLRPSLENGGARPAPEGGLEVTWRLLPDLRWSDGHSFSAEDLRFALEVFPEPNLIEATAPDNRTLVMRWSDQVVEALGSIRPLPKHVLAQVYEEGGSEAVEEYLRIRPTPVMGPYRVVEFTSDERMVLIANPHFVGPSPSIRRVEIFRALTAELIQMYDEGRIDLILPDVLSLRQAEEVLARHPDAVHIRPSSNLVLLQPDLENRLLQKLEVRQALMKAINRPRLVTEVFRSDGRIAHVPQEAPLPIGVEIYQYNPAEARALLKRADAEEMSLLLVHSGSETDRQIAKRLTEDLRDVGVMLQTSSLSSKSLRRLKRSCRFGGLILDSLPVSQRQSPLPFLNLPRESGGFDISVRHDAFDDRMAALIEREARSLLPERRSEITDSIWGMWSLRLPMLPLAFSAERAVVHPALRGWDVRHGVRFGRGLERWYFVSSPTNGRGTGRTLSGDEERED